MTVLILIMLGCLIAWAVYKTVRRAEKGGGCCGEHETALKRIFPADRSRGHYPYRVILSIGGMTCENCAVRVENALNSLPGTWAKVDIAEKKADVLLKEKPDEHELRRAVSGAGYVVTDCR